MANNVVIRSGDPDFSQFVRLTLSARGERVSVILPGEPLPACGTLICDLDTADLPPDTELPATVLCCSAVRQRPADYAGLWLDRPFRPARLCAVLGLVGTPEPAPPTLDPAGRRVLTDAGDISLTEREYRLFSALAEAKGAFLSRETLLDRVWEGETDDAGVVNVYIHYLREKLEGAGQIRILSKRGVGYALREENE